MAATVNAPAKPASGLGFFERYLSVWVALCMIAGVLMKWRRVEHAVAALVGVLVELPVMLSVCAACNRTRHWFPEPLEGHT
jgi:ACR3 family arsenite efflux pump ArsB